MESWSYASEGKGLLFSDEVDFSVDIFSQSKKPLIGWEAESVEDIGVVDLGFTEIPIKPLSDDKTGLEMFRCNEVGIGSSKVVVTSPTCIITSHSSPDSISVDSNSLTESNSSDSSLIDLKLGRLVECTGVQNAKFSRERSVLSSLSPTSSKKKARAISPRAQTPCCVVYGCNKDLSSSKDYHKRHKVCDVHSKTPKVIVNGMEQRFCQQCSRFHLLSEFDDGKRSCRKRLAGHNERRRKPQFGGLTILDSAGTKLLETSLAKRMSLLLPFPGDTLYPERYEEANWLTHVKSEEMSIYGPPVATTARGQLVLKSLLHSLNASRTPPLSTGHNGVLDVGSSIHGLAGLSSHSGCALSLLSAESQDISHFAGSNTVEPLISQAGCAQHSMDISNKLSKVSDTNHTGLHFEAADGLLHESGFLSTEYYNSPKNGSTVDLLQLSSHLQRVEQERNSILSKHENENENEVVFCYHPNYGV